MLSRHARVVKKSIRQYIDYDDDEDGNKDARITMWEVRVVGGLCCTTSDAAVAK